MKLNYRPEIDGLRALAIISVLIYHAKLEIFGKIIFTGGYLGVDIFFVISGFLITRLILHEKLALNNFSFINFYERRIRRIIPVLLVVIFTTYPFATYYLLPIDFNSFLNSINYTLLFVSNIFFHYSGIEYGGTSSLLKPLLHTWSLSIEEQFYILFPIIFLILLDFNKKILVFFISLGIFLSLIMSFYLAGNHPSFNFYMLFSRVWELLLGSLLAIIFYLSKEKILFKKYNKIIEIIGFSLIFFSIIFFNSATKHPSFITLIPVIGIFCLILYSDKKNLITKILSVKPIRFIGLISYSLYLWHYPIFSIARYNDFFDNNLTKFFLIIVSIILSIISYYFIERNFRDTKIISRKTFSITLVIVIFFLLTINFFSSKYKIKNLSKDLVEFDYRPWQKLRNEKFIICHNNDEFCRFEKNKDYPNIYILGDSHASVLMSGIKENFTDKNNFNLITMTTSCFGMPDFNFIKNNKILDEPCNDKYYKNVLEKISNTNNNVIIINARFPLYLSNGNYFDNKEGFTEKKGEKFFALKNIGGNLSVEKGYLKFLTELSNISKKLILVYPVPEVGFNVPRRIFKLIKNKEVDSLEEIQHNETLSTSYQVYMERTKKSFFLLNQLKNNIVRIYPHEIFCNKIRCFTVLENKILYSDENHLSLSGAMIINKKITDELKKLSF